MIKLNYATATIKYCSGYYYVIELVFTVTGLVEAALKNNAGLIYVF